jgi:hypothetical protein
VELVDATALLAADPSAHSGPELSARLVALVRLQSVVEAALIATVDLWSGQQAWTVDGARSGEAWLAQWAEQSLASAERLLDLAARLRSLPVTASAFATGSLSRAKVDLLAGLAADDDLAEAFAADEAPLVAAATNLSVDEAARVLRSWRALVDTRGFTADAQRQWSERRVDLVQQPDGRWEGRVSFDAEGGAVVAAAIARIVDDLFRTATPGVADADLGVPTVAQRQADAVVDLARRAFAAPPDASLPRPLLMVLLDGREAGPGEGDEPSPGGSPELSVLRTGVGRVPGTGPIPRVAVERLSCDALVAAATVDDESSVVTSGLAVRTVTEAQLRALWVRDGGCVFPGCDRPPTGCDAHQIPAVDIEPTTEFAELADLCLVCVPHHRLLHEGGFLVHRLADGRLPFTRPDGRPLLGSGHRLDAYGRPSGLPPHA